MKRMVNIFVDVHEQDSNLPDNLKLIQKYPVTITVKHMTTGDVVLEYGGYTVGIEIKRKHDYQSSTYSGRLHDQICRLYETYDYPVLIVEGYEGDNPDIFWKSINTFNLKLATYVTEDRVTTVELIENFVRLLLEKKFHVVRRPIMLEEEVPDNIRLLCALPFVSRAIAEEILEIYGSPTNAFSYIDEWVEIKRLTGERVASIKDALNKER